MRQIKKAVFPVAGLSTHFLPATKANPKEMLTVVDKPLIQYAVEEAIHAGITQMIFITGWSARAIQEHFNDHVELEAFLQEQGDEKLLEVIKAISPPGIQFSYITQRQPNSLGQALLDAEETVGDEPFAFLLADTMIDDSRLPCLSAMVQHFTKEGHPILAVQSVPWHDVQDHTVVGLADASKNYSKILTMIEKPGLERAPSNLTTVGRYLFTPAVFSCLKKASASEIHLIDALQHLIAQHEVQAYQFYGKRYDCRTLLGYLQAIVERGLRHPEVGDAFNEYLQVLLEA